MLGPASAQQLLDSYEAMRASLPRADFPSRWTREHDLDNLVDSYEAFFFDAFGVLNLGQTPIAGAAERLDLLRRTGRVVKVVSNAAGDPPAVLLRKMRDMGFDLELGDLITSREALTRQMHRSQPRLWGVVTPAGSDLSDLPGRCIHLGDDPARTDEADGFLLFTALEEDPDAQDRLLRSLRVRPRPVWVANADLAAPREWGFSVEPGALAQWLARNVPVEPILFGKPFAPIFDLALQRLPRSIAHSRILMVGDTLHTDVLGGCSAGLQTALVVGQGVSAEIDWESAIDLTGIVPDHVFDRL